MELDLNENANPLHNTIQNIIFSDNILIKLNAINVVINSLNDKIRTKTNANEIKKMIMNLYKDQKFMRKLKYYSQIKNNIELSVEYYGFDYLSSSDYQYDEEFEQRLTEIELKLSQFMGKVLKEISKGVEIEL